MDHNRPGCFDRRASLKLLGAALLADPLKAQGPLTVNQVIQRIKDHVGVPWKSSTVDTIKAGDPDTRVKGIVTTFAPTFELLQRVVQTQHNFIITHEPTFYDHLEDTKSIREDKVLIAKQSFIKEHGLVIWRFHDHWHEYHGDGILTGMVNALGWTSYQNKDNLYCFKLPQQTLSQLAAECKKKLGIQALRAVGRPAMNITQIAFLPGAAGKDEQIAMLERDDVQVLVCGEAREWETVEYVRDAAAQGREKALLLLGHVQSEQLGMKNCAAWLRTFLGETPVTFMPIAEPFWTT